MRNGGTINVNIEIDIEKIALAVPPEDGPLFLFKLFSYFAPESVAAAYVAFDSLKLITSAKEPTKNRNNEQTTTKETIQDAAHRADRVVSPQVHARRLRGESHIPPHQAPQPHRATGS